MEKKKAKPGALLAIIGGPKPKGDMGPEPMSGSRMEAAKAVMQALKDDDTEGFVYAMETMVQACGHGGYDDEMDD